MNVYEGTRPASGGWNVTVNGERLSPKPSQKLWNHSPDGFAWGYGGSGPAQLALAILFHHFNDKEFAVRHHQDFKWKVVAGWPQDAGWKLTGDEINALCAEMGHVANA